MSIMPTHLQFLGFLSLNQITLAIYIYIYIYIPIFLLNLIVQAFQYEIKSKSIFDLNSLYKLHLVSKILFSFGSVVFLLVLPPGLPIAQSQPFYAQRKYLCLSKIIPICVTLLTYSVPANSEHNQLSDPFLISKPGDSGGEGFEACTFSVPSLFPAASSPGQSLGEILVKLKSGRKGEAGHSSSFSESASTSRDSQYSHSASSVALAPKAPI